MTRRIGEQDLIELRNKATGMAYAAELNILILKRVKGECFTEPCPFCGATTHFHGEGRGHRLTHCTGVDNNLEFTNAAGAVFRLQDGYYLIDEDDNRFT